MRIRNAQSRLGWLSLQEALDTLQNWRFIPASDAVRYLETFLLRQDLRVQFTFFFPDQAHECFLNRIKYPWPEKRFFELIEQNLFPLASDALIDILEAEGGGMPWYIPVYSVNRWLDAFTYGEEAQLSDLERAFIFAGTGFTASDCSESLANLGWDAEPLTPINWSRYVVAQDRFVEQCVHCDPGLKDAYTAIAVMTGDTQNFWIDNDAEMIDQIILEWSIANLEGLAAEYKEATELIQLTVELINYVQERPHLVLLIIKFWIESITPRLAEETRPPARPKS